MPLNRARLFDCTTVSVLQRAVITTMNKVALYKTERGYMRCLAC